MDNEADKKGNPNYKQLGTAERELMIHFVCDLYLKGFTYRQIGKQIIDSGKFTRGVSIVTIGNFINKLLNEWKEERVTKLDDMKTIELQRINKLEKTYWDSWERSLAGVKKTTVKKKAEQGAPAVNAGGEIETLITFVDDESNVYTEESFGDPRFLDGVKWCVAMRCKILGIEAPIEFKGTMTSEIKRTTVFNTRRRVAPDMKLHPSGDQKATG